MINTTTTTTTTDNNNNNNNNDDNDNDTSSAGPQAGTCSQLSTGPSGRRPVWYNVTH